MDLFKLKAKHDPVSLMFVPCIIKRSRNNQRYALLCATSLFYIPAPTYALSWEAQQTEPQHSGTQAS
jgi:hypothetical protein